MPQSHRYPVPVSATAVIYIVVFRQPCGTRAPLHCTVLCSFGVIDLKMPRWILSRTRTHAWDLLGIVVKRAAEDYSPGAVRYAVVYSHPWGCRRELGCVNDPLYGGQGCAAPTPWNLAAGGCKPNLRKTCRGLKKGTKPADKLVEKCRVACMAPVCTFAIRHNPPARDCDSLCVSIDQGNWRTAIRYVGGVSGVILFASGIFLRERPSEDEDFEPPSVKQLQDTPVEISGGGTTPATAAAQATDLRKELSISFSSEYSSPPRLTNKDAACYSLVATCSPSGAVLPSDRVSAPSDKVTDLKMTTGERPQDQGKGVGGEEQDDPTERMARGARSMGVVAPIRNALKSLYYRYYLGVAICVAFSMNTPIIHLAPVRAMFSSKLDVFVFRRGRRYWGFFCFRQQASTYV